MKWVAYVLIGVLALLFCVVVYDALVGRSLFHPSKWTLDEVSAGANVAMAVIAAAGVYGFVSWRAEMAGHSMHELARRVMSWANRAESAWSERVGTWLVRDAGEELTRLGVPGPQIPTLRPLAEAVDGLASEVPSLLTDVVGLAGKHPLPPIQYLASRLRALSRGLSTEDAAERRFYADIIGMHDPHEANAQIAEAVAILEVWARPYLAVRKNRRIAEKRMQALRDRTDKLTVDQFIRRNAAEELRLREYRAKEAERLRAEAAAAAGEPEQVPDSESQTASTPGPASEVEPK